MAASPLDQDGTPWSDGEIDLIVADYFAMLNAELAGQSFIKSHRNAELQRHTGRTRGSIEYKHQNISAVLTCLGEPFILGYKPMFNYQGALVSGVERFLDRGNRVIHPDDAAVAEYSEAAMLFIDAAPNYEPVNEDRIVEMARLVRKYDPAARDENNRKLGRAGEAFVVEAERMRLDRAGRRDLAKEVRWVADEDGDGAGYDILSFNAEGHERYLEVKTTRGPKLTPFFLSRNEKDTSDQKADGFRIFRLHDFGRAPRAFVIKPPLDQHLHLRTEVYRAAFG